MVETKTTQEIFNLSDLGLICLNSLEDKNIIPSKLQTFYNMAYLFCQLIQGRQTT